MVMVFKNIMRSLFRSRPSLVCDAPEDSFMMGEAVRSRVITDLPLPMSSLPKEVDGLPGVQLYYYDYKEHRQRYSHRGRPGQVTTTTSSVYVYFGRCTDDQLVSKYYALMVVCPLQRYAHPYDPGQYRKSAVMYFQVPLGVSLDKELLSDEVYSEMLARYLQTWDPLDTHKHAYIGETYCFHDTFVQEVSKTILTVLENNKSSNHTQP